MGEAILARNAGGVKYAFGTFEHDGLASNTTPVEVSLPIDFKPEMFYAFSPHTAAAAYRYVTTMFVDEKTGTSVQTYSAVAGAPENYITTEYYNGIYTISVLGDTGFGAKVTGTYTWFAVG